WSGWYGRLPRVLRRAIAGATGWLRDSESGGGVSRLRRFAAGGDGDASSRMLSFVSRLKAHERARLYASTTGVRMGAAGRLFREHLLDAGPGDDLRNAQFLDYRTFLPDDVLALSDRISMAHGLELRTPFVDHVLVDQVFPLSATEKIGRASPKQLLRQAMRDRLPAAHFSAPKRGFVGPTGAWLRRELRPMIEDELAPQRMQRLGYFDAGAVRNLISDHMTRRADREESYGRCCASRRGTGSSWRRRRRRRLHSTTRHWPSRRTQAPDREHTHGCCVSATVAHAPPLRSSCDALYAARDEAHRCRDRRRARHNECTCCTRGGRGVWYHELRVGCRPAVSVARGGSQDPRGQARRGTGGRLRRRWRHRDICCRVARLDRGATAVAIQRAMDEQRYRDRRH
ncbi:MAG TPA: asparagine synthase-related protein, partial [Gemmatimonadaceae bacterium]